MENYDIQRLVTISQMYHNLGMNQEQIAKKFGISRASVSMCLTEAKNIGIIQTTIKDPSVNNEELAKKLEDKFGLRKCIVVPSGSHRSDVLLHIVTSQAVRFAAEQLFTSHSSIGIAWGSTCNEFMRAFPEETNLCDMNVVPLIGSSPRLTDEFQLNGSIRMFAEKLRGVPLFIYSPGLVDTLDDKRRILESTFMQPVLDRWQNMDYAVLGIGRWRSRGDRDRFYSINESTAPAVRERFRNGQTALEEINSFEDMAVGDLCARQYDIRGNFIDDEYNKKLIGADGDILRTIKNVLAIAVGGDKVFSIIGALRTKVIHYFVTDENTAREVLDLIDSDLLPK